MIQTLLTLQTSQLDIQRSQIVPVRYRVRGHEEHVNMLEVTHIKQKFELDAQGVHDAAELSPYPVVQFKQTAALNVHNTQFTSIQGIHVLVEISTPKLP